MPIMNLQRNSSLWARRSTLGPAAHTQLGASPPALRQAPDTIWQRIVFWLMAPAPGDAAPPSNRVPGIRLEFMRAVADIDGPDANRLRTCIAMARSLRDLWHLRPEVYRIVGLGTSEREAERRLVLLNRHFPTRASRSLSGNLA
jgi:hypothetical protein